MLNRSILAALTVVCISSGQQSGARFLLWHPSAKSISMGGIGVAIDNGVFAAYYNPASLGFINKTSISTSFGQPFPFFENMGHSFIGFSHNFKFGVMAFSANMFWRERQLRTDETGYNYGLDGEKFSYVKPNSSDLKLSISSLIVNNLSFGISSVR